MRWVRRIGGVVFGTDFAASVRAAQVGVALGVAAWVAYPLLGVEYWFLPADRVDYAVLGGFVLVAAAVAVRGAGFLAALWVSYPAHAAIGHYYYTTQSGQTVVLPFDSVAASVLVIAAAVASVPGTVGYVAGATLRWLIDLGRRVGGGAAEA